MKFTLDGKKLQGRMVARAHARAPRRVEGAVDLSSTPTNGCRREEIAELAPRSVVTDRRLIEIARDEAAEMRSRRNGDPPELLKKIIENPKL